MNEVVAKAVELGALQSRLVKQFRCFLPDKKAESEELADEELDEEEPAKKRRG